MVQLDNNFMLAVGKRLKALRKQHNLTVSQLADKLSKSYIGMSEKSIQRCENGKNLPKIENLIALSEILHTTLDYILFGKETSDDNSCTLYDNFRRLNRLIYSLSVCLSKNEQNGKYYFELMGDEAKIYWERMQAFAVDKNYFFEHQGKSPVFTVKDLDGLFTDFLQYNKQLEPNEERMNWWLVEQGIDPEEYRKNKIAEIKRKRKASQ